MLLEKEDMLAIAPQREDGRGIVRKWKRLKEVDNTATPNRLRQWRGLCSRW